MIDRPLTPHEIDAIWGCIGAVLAIAFVVWMLTADVDTDDGDDDLDG